MKTFRAIASLLVSLALFSCVEGPAGPEGPTGQDGPPGVQGPVGEPGYSPSPSSVAAALFEEYEEELKPRAVRMRLLDGNGENIGEVTGLSSWLWDEERQGYLWPPKRRGDALVYEPPPGLIVYARKIHPPCTFNLGAPPLINPEDIGDIIPLNPIIVPDLKNDFSFRLDQTALDSTSPAEVSHMFYNGECKELSSGPVTLDLVWLRSTGSELWSLPNALPLELRVIE